MLTVRDGDLGRRSSVDYSHLQWRGAVRVNEEQELVRAKASRGKTALVHVRHVEHAGRGSPGALGERTPRPHRGGIVERST